MSREKILSHHKSELQISILSTEEVWHLPFEGQTFLPSWTLHEVESVTFFVTIVAPKPNNVMLMKLQLTHWLGPRGDFIANECHQPQCSFISEDFGGVQEVPAAITSSFNAGIYLHALQLTPDACTQATVVPERLENISNEQYDKSKGSVAKVYLLFLALKSL